jgi:hypothetical protein
VIVRIIREHARDWNAWIGLDDGTEPPAGWSFVIGFGETREAAIDTAIEDLEAAIEELRRLRLVEAADSTATPPPAPDGMDAVRRG